MATLPLTTWLFCGHYLAMPKRASVKRPRDRVIRLKASRDEVTAWRKLAVARDRTLSAWIRDLCNAERAP